MMIKNFSEFVNDTLKEGYLRRIISSEINKDERIEDISKREDKLKNIKSWLDEMGVKNYTIDEKTLEIDVDGDVNLMGYYEQEIKGDTLPDYINFREVKGNFDCSYGDLISLKGCPRKVGKNFDCSNNKRLESLEGCPDEVDGYFDCSRCKLKSLEHCPKKVGEEFWCSHNEFKSLNTGYQKKVHIGGQFVYVYKIKNKNNININKEDITKYFDVIKKRIVFEVHYD